MEILENHFEKLESQVSAVNSTIEHGVDTIFTTLWRGRRNCSLWIRFHTHPGRLMMLLRHRLMQDKAPAPHGRIYLPLHIFGAIRKPNK